MHGHLEEIYRALAAAYTYHEADDIRNDAKNIGSVHRQSNLTKALETALDRTEGYLTETTDGPLPEEQRV